MDHTILLVQSGPAKETRTYSDHASVDACMKELVDKFELRVKRTIGPTETVTYSMQDLLNFVEGIHDITCLVYQPFNKTYATYTKPWIKNKLVSFVRKSSVEGDDEDDNASSGSQGTDRIFLDGPLGSVRQQQQGQRQSGLRRPMEQGEVGEDDDDVLDVKEETVPEVVSIDDDDDDIQVLN